MRLFVSSKYCHGHTLCDVVNAAELASIMYTPKPVFVYDSNEILCGTVVRDLYWCIDSRCS